MTESKGCTFGGEYGRCPEEKTGDDTGGTAQKTWDTPDPRTGVPFSPEDDPRLSLPVPSRASL